MALPACPPNNRAAKGTIFPPGPSHSARASGFTETQPTTLRRFWVSPLPEDEGTSTHHSIGQREARKVTERAPGSSQRATRQGLKDSNNKSDNKTTTVTHRLTAEWARD
ncbi:unnamed protein product [Calypogeia fissa]